MSPSNTANCERLIDVGPAGFQPAIASCIGMKLMAGVEGK
jgi:hypothetical protein